MEDKVEKALEAHGLPSIRELKPGLLKPSLHHRSPRYQSYLYPLFGIHRLATDYKVAKPILFSTFVALLQSGIVTSLYVYISFKTIHWFVTHKLLGFQYFSLRPVFSLLEYFSNHRVSQPDVDWYTAAVVTLFQAVGVANVLIGYKLRTQGRKAGTVVLASRPRVKAVQKEIEKEQRWGPSGVLGFAWRIMKSALWTTFITPIYALPVIGQLLFVFLRAPSITRNYLAMFKAQEHGAAHQYGTIGFGIVAGLLQAIPFIGDFFVITNCIGIALWVQDLEDAPESETRPAVSADGASIEL